MTPPHELLQFSAGHAYTCVALFFLLLFFVPACAQGLFFGPGATHGVSVRKTVVGLWILWEMRLPVAEMRRAISGEAIVVGKCANNHRWWRSGEPSVPAGPSGGGPCLATPAARAPKT